MEYIFLAVFIVLCTTLDVIPLKQKKICTQLLLLIIYGYALLLVGLRYQVGVDYLAYVGIYEEVNSFFYLLSGDINFNYIHGEYGYLFLNSLIKSIFDEFAFVTIFMSTLSIGLITYSCYKYSPFVFLSFYLYFTRFFFIRDMGQIRSAVACAIILYSLGAINNQKPYKFLGLVTIAALFHKAALIAVPIYFFNKYDFSNKFYYLCLGASFILGIIIPFDEIIKMYFSNYDNVIIMYALSGFAYELSVFNPTTLLQMFFLVLFIAYKKQIMINVKYYKPMLNMYALSTFWMLIFNKMGILAGRISTMVTTVEIFIIPAVIFGILAKNRLSVLTGYLLVLIIGFLFLYLRIVVDEGFLDLFIPYKSVM